MGALVLTPLDRARLGYALGVLVACVGLLLIAGLGAALLTGGAVTAASSLLLADVDREDRRA